MKNSSLITKFAFILLILGGFLIAFIIVSVLTAGSWGMTPEIVQIWGSLIRPIGEIPIIGNFTFILWVIFLMPGYLFMVLGKKLDNEKLRQNDLTRKVVETSPNPSKEKVLNSDNYIDHDTSNESHNYTVFVDDNFHYMDESERYLNGKYETEEEALSVCRKIVDDYLLNAYQPDITAKELYESYVCHGEDPFIRGGDGKGTGFSAWSYAEKRSIEIVEEKNSENNLAGDTGTDLWKYELDHKYGLLIRESEILEDDDFLYFYQTDRNRLCAAWNKKEELWKVDIDRLMLEGLSFSTPKRFEQTVFGKDVNNEGYFRKQLLIEYFLEGLDAGEIKTLTKEVNNAAKIEFSVEAKTWNEMLIGNPVGVDGGMCKYFEQNYTKERVLKFAMLCNNWEVNIEFLLGDYEEYEQHTFRIKDFGGYYN